MRRVPRKRARSLARAVRQFEGVRNVSRALTATLDRAGGAEQAGDQVWQGRQMRHAVKLANRLAEQLDRAAIAVTATRKVLKRVPLAKRKLNRRKVVRTAKRIAKRGFTRRQARALRVTLGTSKRETKRLRRQVRRTARTSKPPRRLLEIFGPHAAAAFRDAARTFRFYVQVPEVQAMTRLGAGR